MSVTRGRTVCDTDCRILQPLCPSCNYNLNEICPKREAPRDRFTLLLNINVKTETINVRETSLLLAVENYLQIKVSFLPKKKKRQNEAIFLESSEKKKNEKNQERKEIE